MAIGDDAVAAGMAITTGTELANTIDTEINKTRDYIAQRTNSVTPVVKGGTGATTAAAARTNLGISASNTPATGGLGSDVQTALGFLDTVKTSNLSAGTNNIAFSWAGSRVKAYIDGTDQGELAKLSDVPNVSGKVNKSGDTMSGDLYIPGSSAATSSFTVCYVNGDGRISRGSSSERYRKYISDVDPASVGDIFPQLTRFQMRHGDGSWQLGYIAERLDENEDTQRFVVRVNGEVESIDFIQILLAQVANLNARLKALEEGL